MDIFSISNLDLISNETSFIGLLNKSFSEAIFWTFIRVSRFSSLEVFLNNVKIRELPSFKISLFNSKTSEKIKSSNTLDKSVNFKTA